MSNTPKMKGKPSLDEFRTGGGDVSPVIAPPAPAAPAATPAATPVAQHVVAQAPSPAVMQPSAADLDSRSRENKTIRLRKSFVKRLKSDAFHRTNSEGRRVTESDIIDEALEQYFRTHPAA